MIFDVTIDQRSDFTSILYLFINSFRTLVKNKLSDNSDGSWDTEFRSILFDAQQRSWDMEVERGVSPELTIDFGHLRTFSIKKRELLEKISGDRVLTNKLPTYFQDINKLRNDWAHFRKIEAADLIKNLTNLRNINDVILSDNVLKNKIQKLLEKLIQTNPTTPVKPALPRQGDATRILTNKPLTFTQAYRIINSEYPNYNLSRSNSNFASISKNGPFWWLDIPEERFLNGGYLLLNFHNTTFFLIELQPNSIDYNRLFNKRDNGKYQVYISARKADFLLETLKRDYSFKNCVVLQHTPLYS